MKQTKDKIIDTAHRLMNEKGAPNVTLRQIATEMGISQGNLNYHFRKKEEIIEALYYRLFEEANKELAKLATAEINLDFFFESFRSGMESLYEYRFFMVDINQVMRENPSIHQHFMEIERFRNQAYLYAFTLAVQNGIMRPADFEGEYEHLAERIRIFSDFWLASADLYAMKEKETILEKHFQLYKDMLYPYLTKDMQQAFITHR